MRTILILMLTFFILVRGSAQSESSRTFKMLSWNTYMLPTFPIFSHQKKRAKGIVAVLKGAQYDIICFQEAYHKGFQRIILKGLKAQYPYQIKARRKNLFRPSSGLWILSKRPISEIKSITFEEMSGMESLVKKGAILFKMEGLNNFHFIVTHMQSADGLEQTAVRKAQSLQILNELVQPYSDLNTTFLFAGDWNMEAGSAFDNWSLRKLLKVQHPPTMPTHRTWPSPTFSKNSKSYLLDLIMINSPNNKVVDFETVIPNLKYEWKKGKDDLSDHLPIDATFLLKQGAEL